MKRLLSVIVLPGLLFPAGCSTSSDTSSGDPAAPATNPECAVPLGWWESKGLEPLFASATGPAPTKPCQFHLWAWTAFVHFTRLDSGGQPHFLGLKTPADLDPTSSAPRGRLVLGPRDMKRDEINEINQAGSQGVLVDQNGRAVYYSTHLDDAYFDFAKQYYGIEAFTAAPADANFPVGATSIKASWRIVPEGEDTTGLFVTKADIAELDDNPETKTVETTGTYQKDVHVALVGMHVVSVLVDHPEFAWATFELDSNAPNLPAGMDPNAGSAVSAENFTFYKAGTAAKDCNSLSGATHTTVDKATQICSPITQVFRKSQYGGADAENVADIVQVNDEFHTQFPAEAKTNPRLDLAFNAFHLVGTIWQEHGTLKPGLKNMEDTAIGSTSLLNSTMETFVQEPTKKHPIRSCFECHNTAAGTGSNGVKIPAKNIGLSHVLMGPFFE